MNTREHVTAQIAWAEKWLAVPESQLPGTLTHDKCAAVLEKAQDELFDLNIDQARFVPTQTGMKFSHFEA